MFYRIHSYLFFALIVVALCFGFGARSNVSVAADSQLDFSSGTYIPGYTNSKWSSWGKLGGIIGGAPIDPVNQWVGCDPHNPDLGCWSAVSTTFRCPEYSQVYEYAYDTVTKDYRYYAPFEFINSADAFFASQYLDLQKVSFDRWEKCTVSGSVVSPFGGQCGDGNVNIGEDCDPPGRTVVYDNSCPVGSYATATCNSSCKYTYGACSASTSVCGNGRVDSGEACDAGSENGQYGSRCTKPIPGVEGSGCQIATADNGGQFCGNKKLDKNAQGNYAEFCDEEDGACVHIDETGQVLKPEVHILLDNSSSMSGAKWASAKAGIQNIYSSLSDNINLSLSIFSSVNTLISPTTCSQVIGLSNLPAVPNANTPTKSALAEIYAMKDTLFGTNDKVAKKLIIITDGEPTNYDYRNQSNQVTASCQGNTVSNVITEISKFNEAHIQTYIVGFGNLTEGLKHNLNLFAEAGGTSNPDSQSNDLFFTAENSSQLVTSFSGILGCFEYSQYKQNSCSWDCQSYGEYCGDGIVQQGSGEECEASLSAPGACNSYCKLVNGPAPVCGNTQVEGGEQCDDGNLANNDGCSATCSFESSAAACGNLKVETVNGVMEQCDLGPQNGRVCNPQYDNSCTYCSNSCTTITVEATAFCGNGIVDQINPTTKEACDYVGENAIASAGTVTQCPDKGNYSCDNSCLQLTPNCASCGITTATFTNPKISILNPLTQAGYSPYTPTVGYVDIYRKNPPGSTSLTLQWLGYRKINYKTANSNSYIDPFEPYTLFIDAFFQPVTNKGIETNLLCNGEYALLFNKNHISQVKTNSINGLTPVQVVEQKLGDLFEYPVNGEAGQVTNEVVMSPAIPEDAIRIVTRWKKKMGSTLFLGEFYQDKTNQSPSEDGNTFSYFKNVITSTAPGGQNTIVEDGNFGLMGLVNGYWRPISDQVPPTAPGVYMNKFLNPVTSKTAVQGVTLYASSLSSNKPLGFYVTSPNGPINQFKDYELWVDVYTYHAGQVPEHSIYQPTDSFSLSEAVPSMNPVARYWHVFNLGVTGTGSARKITVQKISSANSGLIVTNQCEVRRNMPDTTQCGGLVPFSGGSNVPIISLSVPSTISIGAAQNSTASAPVTSNASSWTVSENIGWLTATPASGSNNGNITFTATQPNITGAPRSGDVTVSTLGATSQTITVTQLAAAQAASLVVSPSTVNVTAGSVSNSSITVTSNINWTAADDQSWLTVTPASGSNNGTLTLSYSPNTSATDRTATITITGGGITRTATITQAGTAPAPSSLSVSPASVSLLAAANSTSNNSVTITSNVAWSVSDNQSWLTVTPASGSNNATLSFTATSANTSANARTATVTVSGPGVTSQTITVTQAGTAAVNSLTLSTSALNPSASSGGTQVGVTSNVTWTASSDQSWLTITPASGSNNGTISVTYPANSGSTRVATITVTGGGITRTVTVTQLGTNASLAVSPASVALGTAINSNGTFTITSNVNWTVADDQSWLTINQTSGSNNATITVSALTANTSANARTATVTVSGPGVPSQTITVTQAGTAPAPSSLSVSPGAVSLASAANSASNNSVAITSNVNWTVADDQTWLTVTPASGSNNGTLSFTATTANTSANARTATVTVSGPGVPSQTITVTQAGTAAVLTVPSTASVGAALNSNASVAVTSNVTWTVSDNETWLTVSPISGSNNGSFTITASQANTSASARTGTVTVTGGSLVRIITVTQAAADSLTVTPAISNVGTGAGTINVAVTSNVSWTVSDDAPWLTVSPASGSNNGNFTISYQSNTSASARTGTVTITGGGITRTVTVNQGFITVTPATVNVSPGAGTGQTFTVSSNVSWSVSDDAPWLAASVTNGSNNQTVTISYNANSGAARSGIITITDGGISRTVTVNQGFLIATPTPLNVSVVCDSGDILSITSNVSWTITENLSWISFNPTTGSNSANTAAYCTDNTTNAIRSGTVTITGGGVSQVVTVNQDFLQISATSANVGSGAGTVSFTVSSNLDWGMGNSVGWLTPSAPGTINNQTVTVGYPANPAGSPARSGNIMITGGGVTRTFTINQAGG
ncbi:MAG TPA: BACON domain-containing carbohydrate-binding protein [Candidatus Magasanikbacteria bacterium]|nr:BACON domain-containing carbohydrate-binding protein [Candidatus Magasanikbacteria bacterium]